MAEVVVEVSFQVSLQEMIGCLVDSRDRNDSIMTIAVDIVKVNYIAVLVAFGMGQREHVKLYLAQDDLVESDDGVRTKQDIHKVVPLIVHLLHLEVLVHVHKVVLIIEFIFQVYVVHQVLVHAL